MSKIISTKNIRKEYKLKNEIIIGLDNITMDFETDNLYAIMGHSGSGKSTLINILGLIDYPTSGDYFLNNKNTSKLSSDDLADERMKNIGFIFQNYYLEENLTALENVCLPMIINKDIKKEDRVQRAKELLTQLGLEKRLNHKPKELSGGEQQRVCIARALANDPAILLCDEPTGNLDEDNEKMVFDTLKRQSELGKCVIVVSHSNMVVNYADKVIYIKNGKLVDFDE